MIIADKISRSIRRRLPILMLTNTEYYLEMARKSKKFKGSINWDTPLLPDHDPPVEKVVDKTGKPKKVDDKMVKTFRTSGVE